MLFKINYVQQINDQQLKIISLQIELNYVR